MNIYCNEGIDLNCLEIVILNEGIKVSENVSPS